MKGFVYIFTNPALNGVKIGKTYRTPYERASELFTTAIPFPFEVYSYLETEKYNEVEKYVHNTLDLITDTRCNESREFFNIEPEKATKILENLVPLIEDAKLWVSTFDKKEMNPNLESVKIKRRKNFQFSDIGVKVGDSVIFKCTNDSFLIYDNRNILVDGIPTSMSKYTHDYFLKEKGKDCQWQGPKYFMYNGKILIDYLDEGSKN